MSRIGVVWAGQGRRGLIAWIRGSGLIDLLDGRVMEDEVSGGARFRDVVSFVDQIDLPAWVTKHPRVIVVDDDHRSLSAARDTLVACGVQTLTACSLAEAKRVIGEDRDGDGSRTIISDLDLCKTSPCGGVFAKVDGFRLARWFIRSARAGDFVLHSTVFARECRLTRLATSPILRWAKTHRVRVSPKNVLMDRFKHGSAMLSARGVGG